jgi:hypothetical protein
VRRPLILVVLIAALAPTSTMAAEWIRCEGDGAARKSCCCPADDREEDPARPAEVSAAGCCSVDKLPGQALDARALRDVLAIAIAPPVRTVIRVAPTEITAVAIARETVVAQPRGPPSLFAQSCLLLV